MKKHLTFMSCPICSMWIHVHVLHDVTNLFGGLCQHTLHTLTPLSRPRLVAPPGGADAGGPLTEAKAGASDSSRECCRERSTVMALSNERSAERGKVQLMRGRQARRFLLFSQGAKHDSTPGGQSRCLDLFWDWAVGQMGGGWW